MDEVYRDQATGARRRVIGIASPNEAISEGHEGLMTSRWGDPQVARALGDVVARLGSRALRDPTLIETEIVVELGGITGAFARQIDALVTAVEEHVPDGMLAGASALDLTEWLEERGMSAEAVAWVLSTWGWVLAEQSPRWIEHGPNDEPPVGPPGVRPLDQPVVRPLDQPVVRPAVHRGRRGRGLVVATVGLLVLVASAVGVFAAFSAIRVDGRGPSTRAALPAGSPTPVPTLAEPGALTGGVVVLARAGGSERFPAGTSPAFVDAARAETPKGLRAAVAADLRWTADDVPVLIENPRITPPMFCARRYTVARATWSTLLGGCLSQASASRDRHSYPVASLSSTLQKLSAITGAQLFLQVKTQLTGRERQILLSQIVQTRMAERVVISSFRPSDLAAISTATPGGMTLRTMLLIRTGTLDAARARRAGYWAVAVRHDRVTAANVDDLHTAGVRVAAWNLDDRAGWAAARSAGVDIVLSNTPRAYLSWAEAG